MKSYYKLAKAIGYLHLESHRAWVRGEVAREKKLHAAVEKLFALAKAADRPRTCGTCLRWFHKSEANGKAWGRCTSEKANEAFYVMFRSIEDEMTLVQMFKAEKHMELRTEENTFGCIHHEPMPEDKEDDKEWPN